LKIPRPLSLFLVLTVISVIVFTIIILVLPPFIKEFNEILVDIPNGLSKINILINTNLNKFNVLLYGEQSENVIDIFSLINNVVTIPDASTIAKAIQESFKNLINIREKLKLNRNINIVIKTFINMFNFVNKSLVLQQKFKNMKNFQYDKSNTNLYTINT